MDHALQWFGGLSGKPVREVCPTGCGKLVKAPTIGQPVGYSFISWSHSSLSIGHKCNLSQTLSAFPRTDSLMCLPTQMEGGGMVSEPKLP